MRKRLHYQGDLLDFLHKSIMNKVSKKFPVAQLFNGTCFDKASFLDIMA